MEVFIFPASFKRSPVFCVLVYLSEPAKSTNDNLKCEESKLQDILFVLKTISERKYTIPADSGHMRVLTTDNS